jgi:hypothetical protein
MGRDGDVGASCCKQLMQLPITNNVDRLIVFCNPLDKVGTVQYGRTINVHVKLFEMNITHWTSGLVCDR